VREKSEQVVEDVLAGKQSACDELVPLNKAVSVMAGYSRGIAALGLSDGDGLARM
jgi:hypothetical protein